VATGSAIDVVMPQMGVSVSEGTVTKWLKRAGDAVAADEPLLEISTDKVDTEVPSPGSGVLSQILVQEGETVEVGTRLAVIGGAAESLQAGDGQVPEPATAQAAAEANAASDAPAPTPTAETAAATWPQEAAATHGGTAWAVFLEVVRGDGEQDALQAAVDSLRSVGYTGGVGDVDCSAGAREALGLDPALTYTAVDVLFATAEEAQQFVDLYEPGVVGTVQVTTYCLD